MSEQPTSARVDGEGPSYVGWRAELLAKLALARVPELLVYDRPLNGTQDLGYDFLVTTADGVCFFVEVGGYSSYHRKLRDPAAVGELQWSIGPDKIRDSRRSQSPVVMFLFDADTEHGRFARLDTLPEPDRAARRVVVSFPVENTITSESLRALVAGLRPQPAAAG